MGGGSTYDEEYAQLIYDLQKVAIDDNDFDRRLGLLQANPNIDRSILLGPKPEVLPLSPSNVIQPIPSNPIKSKTCSICKCTTNVEWVQFPTCTDSNHTFCISCAERSIIKTGVHNNPKFPCGVCGVRTNLNPNLLLKPFIKNVNSEKDGHLSFESGICPFHGDMLLYFCFECLEPICAKCQTGFHADHDYETLDTTFSNAQTDVTEMENEIKDKRSNAGEQIEKLLGTQTRISNDARRRREQLRSDIQWMKEQLDRKEQELLSRIDEIEDKRNGQLEESLITLTGIVDACDNAMGLVDQAKLCLTNSDPMHFVQFVTDKKQKIIDVLEQEEALELPRNTRKPDRPFPNLPTQAVKDSITRMHYYDY